MARIAPLVLGKDINGSVTYFISPPTAAIQCKQFTLTIPGTPVSITVPSWAKTVKLTADPGASIWVNMFGAAVAPTTPVVTDNTSELNPIGRSIPTGVTTISVVSKAICDVNVVFYEDTEGRSPYVL